jgi:hypothetical protein
MSHIWFRHGHARPGLWRVLGLDQFCADGYACVDDYGTLVQVSP